MSRSGPGLDEGRGEAMRESRQALIDAKRSAGAARGPQVERPREVGALPAPPPVARVREPVVGREGGVARLVVSEVVPGDAYRAVAGHRHGGLERLSRNTRERSR